MRAENCSSPVCWLRILLTWLLSAEMFSKDALEKKEILPFFVYIFCACVVQMNKMKSSESKFFFMCNILLLNNASFEIDIRLKAKILIGFAEATAKTFQQYRLTLFE